MFKPWFLTCLVMLNMAVFQTVIARHRIVQIAVGHTVAWHKINARLSLLLMATLILTIEGYNIATHQHAQFNTLNICHWFFAFPCFAGLLLLNFSLNGKKSSKHILYACLTIVSLLGTDITGVYMALSKF